MTGLCQYLREFFLLLADSSCNLRTTMVFPTRVLWTGENLIIIIIKRISGAPVYRTRWEHRALYSNTRTHTHARTHTQTQTHTHTHTHTLSHTHTHTHTHTHSLSLSLSLTHTHTHSHTHTHTPPPPPPQTDSKTIDCQKTRETTRDTMTAVKKDLQMPQSSKQPKMPEDQDLIVRCATCWFTTTVVWWNCAGCWTTGSCP